MRRARVEIDWADVFGFGTCSSSPDRADDLYLGAAPAARAAKNGGDEPWRGVSDRRHLSGIEDLPSRTDRGAGERRRPSTDAAAKADGVGECMFQEDEREGEGGSASAAKKSRKLDIEKEDALLHMLGEINKSLQASLKSAEPLQVPKGTSPEEIFEALRGIPRLARADLLRGYSMLIRDDRRFRSLMALPKNMRKEWLLMEIGSI